MNVTELLKDFKSSLSSELEKNHRLKIGDITSVTINKQALKALKSFWPRKLAVPEAQLSQYPSRDTPLVVQIWSGKLPQNHFSDLHGQAHYDGISVCSDGIGGNSRVGIRPDNRFFTTKIFLLSPQLMGLNKQILSEEMKQESQKVNDYDLSQNNCIDHVIRPMQKAGLRFDFGPVATPKRLSEFCEQMVKEGKGILIQPKTYDAYLKRHPMTSKNTPDR